MNNIVGLTDSYKIGHHNMYPEGTQKVYSYFEARNGAKYDETTFFGLQYLLKKYFCGKVVTKEKIDEIEEFSKFHFNNDQIFKRERWDYILNEHDGYLPLKIKAIPEGLSIPINNVMMTVENTDNKCHWLTNHCETILTHVWYGSNVATISRFTKKLFIEYLERTSDFGKDFPGLNFMLHDFGFRGVSSSESAAMGGSGHLINFYGTDTIIAPFMIKNYYNNGKFPNAFSVPATEHSIMTSLGKNGEIEVIKNLIEKYNTGILSVVSDSYDIFNCVENIYGKELKDSILNRNGKFVVRPDSGDPVKTIETLLNILWNKFGGTINTKGYKVLNPKVGLIWGDGINYDGISSVLHNMELNKFSVENIVFGMGGGLLQKHNRDTQRFAFKSSSQFRNNVWQDIFKDPIDSTKVSKKGRLKLIKENNQFKTVHIDDSGDDIMNVVFENGIIKNEIDWSSIVNNSAI